MGHATIPAIAAICLVFWLVGALDVVATLGRDGFRLPAPTVDPGGFLLWRMVFWSLAVLLGLAGSLALVLRRRAAPWLLAAAAALMLLGFAALQLLFGESPRYLGTDGVIASIALVGVASGFAAYARWAGHRDFLR